MKAYLIFLIIIFSIISCNSKEKLLTGGNCKYWNTIYIKRQSGEIENKRNISFEICENGFIDWFFISKNGDRTKLNYGGSHLWKIENDSLFADLHNFKIMHLDEDSLVLVLNRDHIYFKNERRKR